MNRFRLIALFIIAGSLAASPALAQRTQKPARETWSVKGTVVDGNGDPIPGVTVSAATGWGTLRRSGQGTTDADGRYAFEFGPGVFIGGESDQYQVATIYASKKGFFEKNLCRDGDLAMANRIPDSITDPDKRAAIIVPGKPRTINFCMLPAAQFAGEIVDEKGDPLDGYAISLKGTDLPPSSSVASSAKTDENGRFSMASVPTGFSYQLLIQPAKRHWPWNAWASGPFEFKHRASPDIEAVFANKKAAYRAKNFRIRLKTQGVNWKRALKIATDHQSIQQIGATLELTLDPPGAAQSKVEPKSMEVSLRQCEARPDTVFDPVIKGTIDLTEKYASLEIPSAGWSFARPNKIATKLSSNFRIDVYFDFIGLEDPERRILVELDGIGDGNEPIYQTWRVVTDASATENKNSTRARIGIPRLLLADIREIQIGMRELSTSEIENYPETRSRTNLRVSQPSERGDVTLRFDNPEDRYTGKPMSLDPEMHQVIFQVVSRDADGTITKKELRQIDAKEQGGYEQTAKVKPEDFDRTRVSMTFVTIQPNHDDWVDRFFQKGQDTSYKGMWTSDGALLSKSARLGK